MHGGVSHPLSPNYVSTLFVKNSVERFERTNLITALATTFGYCQIALICSSYCCKVTDVCLV